MKLYLSDRWCSCYTCLPKTAPAAQTAVKTVAALGTGTPPKDQRLLTIAMPKQSPEHTHTYKQRQILRNSTTIHKNSKQNQARTILRISTIAWT